MLTILFFKERILLSRHRNQALYNIKTYLYFILGKRSLERKKEIERQREREGKKNLVTFL